MEPYCASKNIVTIRKQRRLKNRPSPWERRKEHLIPTDIMARTDAKQSLSPMLGADITPGKP